MDRLSRFRRNKDKDKDKDKLSLSLSSSSTPKASAKKSHSRTPSPAPAPAPHQTVAPPIPPRSHRKEKGMRSPFHGLHLRASGTAKRARESPPASLPQSPTVLAASPVIWSKKEDKLAMRGGAGEDGEAPRIPNFLTLSEGGE